jgi:hypothetical protein
MKAIDELVDLRNVLSRFATAEGFTTNDDAEPPPAGWRGVFYLILNRDDGVEVHVSNVREPLEVLIFIYQRQIVRDIEPVVLKLQNVVRDRWPDLASYAGP